MYHKTVRPWEEQTWLMAPSEGSAVSISVQEKDVDTFSGLYDVNGVPLHRQKEKLGFVK